MARPGIESVTRTGTAFIVTPALVTMLKTMNVLVKNIRAEIYIMSEWNHIILELMLKLKLEVKVMKLELEVKVMDFKI